MGIVRGAKWRAVKQANPDLTDEEVDALVGRAIDRERELVLRAGLNLDQARELTNQELFPEPTKDSQDRGKTPV